MDEFLRLVDDAIRIYESPFTWRTKYDMIFSARVAEAIGQFTHIDYWHNSRQHCREDAEEAVSAYIQALKVAVGRAEAVDPYRDDPTDW